MAHRIYHKRWCEEHQQNEVCLCTLGVDHAARRTTVSKSQQAQARWCERVNRAHRAAWAHAHNVAAWTRVYGTHSPGARAYVGTYASDVTNRQGVLGEPWDDRQGAAWQNLAQSALDDDPTF